MKLIRSEPNALLMRREVPNTRSGFLLGVDLGSSGLKAILLHPEKGISAVSSKPLQLFSDNPGWSEADPVEWWKALCSVVPELLNAAGCAASDISAIAISGMVPAVVIADAKGNALRRAMLQNDARATKEIKSLAKQMSGFDFLKLTGSQLTQQSVAPTAIWLAHNEADIWNHTKMIMGSYDWMSVKLGAEPHVELNWAIESGLYGWDRNPITLLLDSTEITWPELLPAKRSGTLVGTINAIAASETGLAAGTEIYVGGADHVLSAYGAGLVTHGDCLVKLGGAGDILAVSDEFFIDPRLYLDAHPIEGKWLPNGCMATSGSVLRWEQHLLGDVDIQLLDAEASTSKPGALLSLPYFLGEKSPLHDPDLRGVIAGLHLGTTRGDLHRSFLECIAYGFKQHFDVFAEGGLVIQNCTVTNGGSKSRLWREILADVLGRNLTSIINHPGASFGAAVAAGIGCGVIDDWNFVKGALEAGEIIEPNLKNRVLYLDRYEMYKELQISTVDISHKLAWTK